MLLDKIGLAACTSSLRKCERVLAVHQGKVAVGKLECSYLVTEEKRVAILAALSSGKYRAEIKTLYDQAMSFPPQQWTVSTCELVLPLDRAQDLCYSTPAEPFLGGSYRLGRSMLPQEAVRLIIHRDLD